MKIPSILETIAKSNMVKRFENWAVKETPLKANPQKKITNYSKLQNAYPMSFMLFIGIVQMLCIYKSKDMPKERKFPLLLNIINNDIIAIIGGLILNNPMNKFIDKAVERAKIIYKINPDKPVYINGIKTAIPFIVSAFMFKYLGAVIATPLAHNSNKLLIKAGLIDYSDTKNKKTDKIA